MGLSRKILVQMLASCMTLGKSPLLWSLIHKMERLFPLYKHYVIQSGLFIRTCEKPEMECLLPLENSNLTAKGVFIFFSL